LTDYLFRIKELIKRLLALVLLFALVRLFFFVFNHSMFPEISTGEILKLFIAGIRFDLSVIIYFNFVVIILYLLPVGKIFHTKVYRGIIRYYFVIVNALLLTIGLADSVFFRFTQKRSTIDVLEFISLSDESVKLMPKFMADYWFVPLFAVLAVVLLILFSKNRTTSQNNADTLTLKNFALQFVILLLGLGIGLVGARGGFQLRPLSVMHATSVTKAKYVPIVLNTPFTVMTSVGHQGLVERKYFGKDELKKYFEIEKFPAQGQKEFRDKNIVILLLESFSKEYVGSLNNYPGYTPFLDSLMQHSLVFTNAYSNGYRSLDAIPSIVASVPCLMDDPITTSVYSSNKFTTIADLLKEKNYQTAFFHGGTNGTLGLDGFAKMFGFDEYFGRTEYGNDQDYDGYWGIYDEPFLQYMLTELDKIEQPFLAMEFALSSHYPYSIPEKYQDKFKEGSLRIHRVIRYSDFALRRFFEVAKTKEWYKNTIFIISADHPAQSVVATKKEDIEEGENLPAKELLTYYNNTSGKHAIPIIFFAPGDTNLRGQNEATMQQTNIMPTVLSLLNYNKPFLALGYNAFDSTQTHAAFNFISGLYQITTDNYCLLFNGKKSTALFAKTDLGHKKNLLKTKPLKAKELENILKAYLQDYSTRMRDNKLKME